jgi:pimeloyl-ACP methyl ester carboxylesterase
MNRVQSKDGTSIAYDRVGSGPVLIMVTGAIAKRADAATVASKLCLHFTVFTYDRRGRGDSGDTLPYAVAREIEDLNAIIAEAGGSAFVFGHSSGAVLALEAARALGSAIPKLAVYEPPILVDDSRARLPENYLAHLKELVAAGRRAEAVEYHMRVGVGVPDAAIAAMRQQPSWKSMEAVAHTLVYDNTIVADTMSGKPLSREHWAAITVPTLVMVGEKSPKFFQTGTQALAHILPHAQRRSYAGQSHGVADDVLVPALVAFFIG